MHKFLEKDKWIIANEEDGANLWAIGFFCQIFYELLPKYAKLPRLYHFIDFKKGHLRFVVPGKYAEKFSTTILNRVLKNPGYFGGQLQSLRNICGKLGVFSRRALKLDLGNLTGIRLAELFETHRKIVQRMITIGMVSTLSDIPHGLFTAYVDNFLKKRVYSLRLSTSAAEFFQILSSIPEQSAQQEDYIGLLKILASIQRDGKAKKSLAARRPYRELQKLSIIWKMIQNHTKRYCWAYYGYQGPAFDEGRTVQELAEISKAVKSANQTLRQMQTEKRNVSKKIAAAEKILALSQKERRLLAAFRDTMRMKLVRKDALTFSLYTMEPLLRETAKKLKLSLLEVRNIAPGEHARAFAGDQKLLQQLRAREKYSVFQFADLRKNPILVGREAERLVNSLYKEEKHGNITELQGQIACLGNAVGAVKIVNVQADMKKMNKGDILVSIATTPDIVPAMKKAAAIVTEQGGITSHAAIVSREMGTPCVIGTKIATKVLRDGDLVEVDANKGIVRKIK